MSTTRFILESHFRITRYDVCRGRFEKRIFNKYSVELSNISLAIRIHTKWPACTPLPRLLQNPLCVQLSTMILYFYFQYSFQILTCCTTSPRSVTLEEQHTGNLNLFKWLYLKSQVSSLSGICTSSLHILMHPFIFVLV